VVSDAAENYGGDVGVRAEPDGGGCGAGVQIRGLSSMAKGTLRTSSFGHLQPVPSR